MRRQKLYADKLYGNGKKNMYYGYFYNITFFNVSRKFK